MGLLRVVDGAITISIAVERLSDELADHIKRWNASGRVCLSCMRHDEQWPNEMVVKGWGGGVTLYLRPAWWLFAVLGRALTPQDKQWLALLPLPTFEESVDGTKQFFRELNRLGLTGVTDPGGYTSNYLTLALFGFSNVPVTITPIPAASSSGRVSSKMRPFDRAMVIPLIRSPAPDSRR